MTEPEEHPSASRASAPGGFSCILFDLDGTLVNSAPGITSTISYTLARMGWPPEDEATLLQHAGPPLAVGFHDVSGMTTDEAERATAIYRDRYVSVGSKNSSLFPGIPELLEELAGAGIPLGVATSKNEESAVPMLDRFGLRSRFAAIVGADAASGRASKADVVREALARLSRDGYDTSRPVLVGDRRYDVEGAATVGIPAIGVLWGYATGAAELSGAIAIAATPKEAATLLLGPLPAKG